MQAVKVLDIVIREMTAIGQGWRLDWSDFDGRGLRDQLDSLASFAWEALKSDIDIDYNKGTIFLEETLK